MLRRASVRLSIIPQDIVKKLTNYTVCEITLNSSPAHCRLKWVRLIFNVQAKGPSDSGGRGYKRCLPFVKSEWPYIMGGLISSITLGAQMPGKLVQTMTPVALSKSWVHPVLTVNFKLSSSSCRICSCSLWHHRRVL